MPHYQNSLIYKLKHNEDYDDTNIYVGSTSNFKNRKNQHKNACFNEKNKRYNLSIYQYIRDNGGWDNWVMIPIEQYPCNSKKELLIRERHHIDLLRPTFNKQIPTRTPKEYREDNKENYKKWREDNKKAISEYDKKWRKANKEKKQKNHKKWRESHKEEIKEKKKQNYEANKEQILERTKDYYENNKEIINQNKKQTVICDHCGFESRKDNLKRHQQSKKCINFKKD